MTGRSADWKRVAWPSIVTVLFLVSQRFTLAHFWRIWNSPDHYYAHGPLAPILAGIMVWMNWDRIKSARVRPSFTGIILAGIALVIQIIGAAIGFEELSGLAFLLMIYAVVLSLFGWRICRMVFWPILFLITVIPLPQITLDSITARYQLLSSFMAAKALWLADHSIIAHGNTIVGQRLAVPLIVGPACSGLRISMTLVMCVFFLVYTLEGSPRQKALLAVSALPIGALINAVRIFMIGFAAMRTGSADTINSVHNASGAAGVAACSVLLLGVAWLSGMRSFRAPFRAGTVSPAADSPRPALATGLPLIIILCCAIFVGSAVTGAYSDLPKGSINRAAIPASVFGLQAQETPIDKVTRKELDRADLMSLAYCRPSAPNVVVYVFVDSAVDISMLHDPRLCLMGGGGSTTREQIIRLSPANPALDGAPAWLLHTNDSDGHALMLCVYRTPDRFLPTKDAVNRYTMRTRLTDLGQMIRNPLGMKKIKDQARGRQITWYRFVMYGEDTKAGSELLQRFAEEFIDKAIEKHVD